MQYFGFIFSAVIVYLKGKETGRRKEGGGRGILHLLIHFANACDSQDWARVKPEARSSMQDAHRSVLPSTASQAHGQEAVLEAKVLL